MSFEHVEAIQALITHAGPTYWFLNGEDPDAIHRFEAMLVWLADQLHDEMSLLRRTMKPGEIRIAVGDILMKCDSWIKQLTGSMRENQLAPEAVYHDTASDSMPMPIALGPVA